MEGDRVRRMTSYSTRSGSCAIAAWRALARRTAGGCLLALALLAPRPADAHVTRIEITQREAVLGGRAWGLAGPYEKLAGKVYFAVDPGHPRNAAITDLRLAPRNAQGLVEFSADLYILRPRDPSRGNGALLFEAVNRGGKNLLIRLNRAQGAADPTAPEHFGDGFLLEQGFTLVWVGWQFDVPVQPHRMRLEAPVATDGGRPIAGPVRVDWVVGAPVFDRALADGDHLGYPVRDTASRRNVLTVRSGLEAPRRVVPRAEWSFARHEDGRAVPDAGRVHLRGGFQPGSIYEFVYEATEPRVAGLGMAAVRDLVSHLKFDPASPAPARFAYAFGESQSGRFLRQFLYDGFNADEAGRHVFEGMIPHIAGGGRGGFNVRFAQPSRASMPLSGFALPNDIFPFSDAEQTDPLTGRRDGLLRRVRELGVQPRIFHTNSSSEYYSRAGSLIHTTPDGQRDVPLPDSVRLYVFAGSQHVPGPFPAPVHGGQMPVNPNDFLWSLRALVVAMHRWVADGVPPPPSRYPTLADGSLVPPERLAVPAVPGLEPPGTPHLAYRVEYGPRFTQGIIDREPPRVGRAFGVLVPQLDADGNERGGIQLPEVAVPLATYTAWNPRRPELGFRGELAGLVGGFVPFARTRAERERSGDPRPSIEERYAGRDAYLGAYAEATLGLVRDGYLRAEDFPTLLELARQRWAHLAEPTPDPPRTDG